MHPAVRLALPLPLLGVAAVAIADTPVVGPPTARNVEPVSFPYRRIAVTAQGTILADGLASVPCAKDGTSPLPTLLPALRSFQASKPDGGVLLVGDPEVDSQVVLAVIGTVTASGMQRIALQASPAGAPLAALNLLQPLSPGDFISSDEPDHSPGREALIVHVAAAEVNLFRAMDDKVVLPRLPDGALPIQTLTDLLAEDRRLYPAADKVVILTDHGVPFADLVAVLDRTRGQGYGQTLVGGGAPVGPGDAVHAELFAATDDVLSRDYTASDAGLGDPGSAWVSVWRRLLSDDAHSDAAAVAESGSTTLVVSGADLGLDLDADLGNRGTLTVEGAELHACATALPAYTAYAQAYDDWMALHDGC
jgi:biopolymer transport protein ExbD